MAHPWDSGFHEQIQVGIEGMEARWGKRSMLAKVASSITTPSNVCGYSKSLMFGDVESWTQLPLDLGFTLVYGHYKLVM